jgi:hypothetical protein
MAFTLKQIREAAGGLKNLTDEEILDATYDSLGGAYSSMDEYAAAAGYEGAGRGKWSSLLSTGVDNYQAGWYGLGEELVNRLRPNTTIEEGLKRGRLRNEAAAGYASQRAAEQGAIQSYKDIGGVGDAFQFAGEKIVESLPYAAEAAIGGLAGRALVKGTRLGLTATGRNVASGAGVFTASYPSSAGSILQAQREQSGGETDLMTASALAVPFAALNVLGLEGALGRTGLARAGTKMFNGVSGVKGAAARTGATFAKTGAIEGATETGQETLSQAGRLAVDPNASMLSPDALERYEESFAAGFAAGGSVGAANRGWRRTEEGGTDLTKPSTQTVGLQDTGTLGESLTGTGAASMLGQRSPGLTGAATPLPLGKTLTTTDEGKTAEQIIAEQEETTTDVEKAAINPASQILSPDLELLADYQVDRNKTRGPKQQKRGADLIRRYEAITSDIAAEDPAALTAEREARLPGSGEYILQGNWPKLEKLLATAEEDAAYAARAQAAAAEGTTDVGDTIAPVPQPAGSVGGPSPDVEGSVAPTGPVLTGERGLPTGGDTAGAVPADGQTLPVSSGAVQPATTVAPAAEPVSQATTVVRDLAREIYPKEADAVLEGLDTDLSQTELANKYGLDRRELSAAINAFPAQLQALVEAKNFSPEQKAALVASMPARVVEAAPEADSQVSVLDQNELLSGEGMSAVGSAGSGSAKVSAKSSRKPRTEKQQQTIDDLRTQLEELAASPEEAGTAAESEAAITTLSQKIQSLEAASTPASEIVDVTVDQVMKLDEQINRLQASIDAAVAAGNEKVTTSTSAKSVAAAKAELAKLREAIAKEIAETKAVASKLGMRSVDKPAETKATPTQTEARQRWRDAKQDLTKLSVEDLNVLLPYVRDTLKNTKLASSISAEISSRGATDAVQKPSAAQVPVRERAAGSQEVGEGDTQGRQAATEGQAQTQKVTAEPTAQAAWDAAVAEFPDAPKFADLTKEQQQTFTDFGPENWTPADVTQELATIQRQITGKITNKSKSGDRIQVVDGKETWSGVVSSRAELEKNPFIKSALAFYDDNGLGAYADSVEVWVIADENSDFDAAVFTENGKRGMAIRADIAQSNRLIAGDSVHHEMGHVLDDVFGNSLHYSQDAVLNVAVRNGRVSPMGQGAVMQEVVAFYNANKSDNGAGEFLRYPLDFKKEGAPSSQTVREEVFAQLWTLFTNPKGNRLLKKSLPKSYAFMESVYEAAYENADVRAGQTTGQTAPSKDAKAQAAGKGQAATGNLRASRSVKGIRFTDRVINRLPEGVSAPVRFSRDILAGWLSKGVDYAVFTNDLINRMASQGMDSARVFSELLAQSRAMSSEMERAIEKVADKYALIEEKDKGTGPRSANQFLFESTRKGKWGYGKYADPEMATWFGELGPKSQAFVKEIFAHGDAILAKKKKIVMDSANTEYDARIAEEKAKNNQAEVASLEAEKKATLSRFQTLFKIHEGKPYAPIKRQGSHVVVAKSIKYTLAEQDVKNNLPGATTALRKLEQDPDHYHVTFTDGKIAGASLQRRLEEQGSFDTVELVEKRDPKADVFGGESLLPALNKIKAGVDVEVANGDRSAARMRTLISDMYLQAMAEASARKSEMRRRGISGEVDMLQSFTQQGRADALFLANIQNSPKIQKALRDTFSQSKEGGDRTRKSELFNELEARYVESLEYAPNEFVSFLTSVASKYFLASSIGYYVQNLTQPFMMSLPAMAGKHDYTKAAVQLGNAYSELGPIMKATKLFDQQFDFSKVPKDVADAVAELVNRNVIDIGLATEIAEYKVDADSKLTNTASKINKGMRLAVQKTEALNRLSTAIAAYRLEIAAGSTKEQAIDYAQRILTETHGDYTSFNAPRAFNTTAGKVALQFRKFQLIQITFYAKLINDAGWGSKTEKAIARKTLSYAVSHAVVFSGLIGFPGYALASTLVSVLFGDEDEDVDLTQKIRESVGPEWADLVTRGVPTLAGVDFSGKIGYGNMLSITPFSNADLGTTSGRAEYVGTLVGGASGGMITRVIDGLVLMAGGDWFKGIERVAPKGVSDALKAYRTQTEGMTRRNRDEILAPEEVDTLANIFSAIGVPAAQQAVIYENSNLARDIKEKFTDRTSRIKNDYIKAVKDNDQEGKKEARAAWKKLQDAKRRNGVKPTPLSTLLKAPMEQRKRERNTVGGIQYTKRDRALARALALED